MSDDTDARVIVAIDSLLADPDRRAAALHEIADHARLDPQKVRQSLERLVAAGRVPRVGGDHAPEAYGRPSA